MELPTSHQDLLKDETKAFAFLATIMEDGTPQVTPMWFDVDDHVIWINTARGRVKDHNMRERPNVALTIMDLRKPYRYLLVRGQIVEEMEEGANEHINKLSRKYTGHDYTIPKGQVRVKYAIHPEATSVNG